MSGKKVLGDFQMRKKESEKSGKDEDQDEFFNIVGTLITELSQTQEDVLQKTITTYLLMNLPEPIKQRFQNKIMSTKNSPGLSGQINSETKRLMEDFAIKKKISDFMVEEEEKEKKLVDILLIQDIFKNMGMNKLDNN